MFSGESRQRRRQFPGVPTVTRERDSERGRQRDFAESDNDPWCPDSDEVEEERRRDFAESDNEGERRRERETARGGERERSSLK
jgi:hypothetical protein